MPNDSLQVTIHYLPTDRGKIIILQLFDNLFLIVLVLVILVLFLHQYRLLGHPIILQLRCLLDIALTIVRQGHCLQYVEHLDMEQATSLNLGQPQQEYCRPASVCILVPHHQLVVSRVLGVMLFGFHSQ